MRARRTRARSVGASADRPSASYRQLSADVATLVRTLAPALGLDPDRVRVELQPGVGPVRGRAAADRITLSGALDGGAPTPRAVLVHELVHARQHRNRGTRPADLTAAEAEAAALANALSAGRALWVPRQVLPDGHVARDQGALGIAPTTPDQAGTPDVLSLERTLDTYVGANHSADLRTISGLLDHPWTQFAGDMIDNCLRLLSALRFVVARALVRALPRSDRLRLAQLDDAQHARFPDTAIAVLSALSTDELRTFSVARVTLTGIAPHAASALHGVDPGRLSPIARRALLATLRRLPIGVLTDLEHGDRRDVFRQLFASGPDTGTDETALREAIAGEQALSAAQAGGGDDILYEHVRDLLRSGDQDHARLALTALQPISGPPAAPTTPAQQPALAPTANPPTLEDLRTAVAQPATTGTGSNAPPSAPTPLIAMVARLDADGLIGTLVESLSEEDRRGPTYGPVLRVVLAARAPLPNVARATELLSYGVLDWKIWDAEARLAYLLVRSAPIAAQDSWRQLDNGKWQGRLEDNLPDDMWSSGEYTGVGSEYVAGGGADLGVPAALLQGYADAMIKRYDDLPIPPIARNLVRELLGLDHRGQPAPWLTDKGVAAKQDPALRIAIIRRIDARGRLNGIIDGLPDDYLFGEQGRHELLDLNQLRDPQRLIRQALSLAPSGFGWLTFTHRDAWLAVQAIRALSPGDQQRFGIEHADTWTALWDGLTADMRAALPTTLATGNDPRLPTRAALRERINDERLWTEANADLLRALLDLAYAADDRAWVFAKSRELRADRRAVGNPKLTALVHELGLYSVAERRTSYVPQLVEASRAPVWGHMLGVIGRAIGILAYDLLLDDSVSLDIFGKTMHLQGFDLGDLQTIQGGDLSGVQLDRSAKGANRIDVDATFEAGFVVNVDLKDLEIAGVNIVLPGKSYKSGPISVKGLKATAGFSDRGYHDPAYIAISLDALALRDLVMVDPALPLSGAWAIARLALQAMNLRASQDGAEDPLGRIGQGLPKGTIPIPVLGPLFQALKNIVALNGGIPGDYTLIDLATLPMQMPFPASTAFTFIGNQAVSTPAPASYLWGLASDGVLRPPYSAAQRMRDAIGMLRAFNVSFASLNVDGISLGAGQQIRSLALTDVNVGVGQSLPAYLNSTLRTIRDAQARLKADSQQYRDLDVRATALQAQIASLETNPRLEALRHKRSTAAGSLTESERRELAVADRRTSDEARLRALEGKDRWHPGSLTEPERAELVRLSAALRSDVGISAEIGSITLGPLSGTVQSAGITLKGIHAQARLPNVGILPYAPGYLDDKSLIEQFVKGGPRVPTIGELAKRSEFSLTVDETTMAQTDPRQPAIILKAETLPTVPQLRASLAALPDIEGNRPIRARLAAALDTLMRLDRARGAARLAPTDAERATAAQQVRELTDEARRLLGVEIGGLRFGRITGALDPATGTIKATIHDTEITGLAGPGFAVDRITGSLEVGLSAGTIGVRLDQLGGVDPHTLAGQLAPAFGLTGVTAEGIHLPQGLIKSAKLGALTASLRTTAHGYRVPDLHIDFLELDDIAIGVPGADIVGSRVRIDELRLDAEVELAAQAGPGVQAGQPTRAVVHSLRIGAISGQHVVADLSQPEGKIHAELIDGSIHDVAADDVELAHTGQGWELLRATGSVGSFADVRYALLLSSLKSGSTSVAGTLTTAAPGPATAGRAAQGPTISASYVKSQGNAIALTVAGLQARGTDVRTPDGKVRVALVNVAGAYTASDAGAKASATLTDLSIGAIDWKAGTGRLRGAGPVTAASITVAAFATPDGPAKDGKPARKGGWTVTDIVITDLEGANLRYTDAPLDLRLGASAAPVVPGPPLRIGRVHLQPARQALQISNLSADFSGDLKKSLQVSGHLGLDSLQLELNRGGHLVAVVRGVEATATVSGDYAASVAISGLRGATVDVGPDGVSIGSDDPADPTGLRIDQISVTSLDITSAAGGHRFHLKTQPAGRVDLLGLRVKARIDKWKPGETHKSKSPWKQIAFERLYIEKINLGAFQIDLPDDDVTIVVPARAASDPPTLHRLDLSGPPGFDPAKLHPDFTINLDTMAIEGLASVTDIALPIFARVKDRFKGDVTLTTWTSSIGFLAGGGIQINVERPRLTMAKAAELGKDKTVRIGKLGAESLQYTDWTGHLYVKRPYAEDLQYTQKIGDSLAVWIKVKAADLGQLDYNQDSRSVDIDTLDIADAFISLDLAALSGPKKNDSAATDAPSSFDLKALRPIVDEINGTVKVVLYVAADVGDWKDIRIGTTGDPLVVPIRNGTVDIPEFEHNVKGKVSATDIGEHWWYLRPWVVGAVARDPILRLDGPQLQLGVYIVDPPKVNRGNDSEVKNRPANKLWQDILTWDLHGVDLDRARADRFSLWTAIFDLHSSPPLTDEQLAQESASQRSKREEKERKSQRTLDSLEVRSLDADLSVRNQGLLPITLRSDAVKGTVTLSDKALLNLHVSGGIPAVRPPAQRPGLRSNPSGLSIGLDALKVASTDLTLYDRAPDPADPKGPGKLTGLSGLKTGRITINDLTDASLSFDDLFTPQRFVGTIKSAHAENIRWFKY